MVQQDSKPFEIVICTISPELRTKDSRHFLGSLSTGRLENSPSAAGPNDMKDQNIVFALESERLENIMVHGRSAARDLWAQLIAAGEKVSAACLITGVHAPLARLHPAIKGVWGAQTSGASIVSFNLDAFTSYGHEQGDNAPISEAAAFAYTSTLNHFLVRDNGHCVQIGDASTVFWAGFVRGAASSGSGEFVPRVSR